MIEPNILAFDIETSQRVSAHFGMWDVHISPEDVIQDTMIICAAWGHTTDREIHAETWKPAKNPDAPISKKSDYLLCKKIHKAMTECDAFLTQNGDKFDIKILNTRFIYHGLPPIPKKPSIDTLKIAKKHFSFSSNKLDNLLKTLKIGSKMDTPKGLWKKVLHGCDDSLKIMLEYNKVDVLETMKLWDKFKPWADVKLNMNHFSDASCCPKCGSEEFQSRGYHHNVSVTRVRYRCNKCFGWFSGKSVDRAKLK